MIIKKSDQSVSSHSIYSESDCGSPVKDKFAGVRSYSLTEVSMALLPADPRHFEIYP